MANTYTQCYFHLVFAVKNRNALIQKSWKDELERYTTSIIQECGHKLLAIGSMPDHIHIFIGYNINQTIPKLVDEVKACSNGWIKSKHYTPFKFEWQKGYGAFTYSHSQIDAVVKYIMNQEKHHPEKSFRKEYLEILRRNEIAFIDQYVFEFFEDGLTWK